MTWTRFGFREKKNGRRVMLVNDELTFRTNVPGSRSRMTGVPHRQMFTVPMFLFQDFSVQKIVHGSDDRINMNEEKIRIN